MRDISEIKEKIGSFIKSSLKRRANLLWIRTEYASLYIRKSNRYIENEFLVSFDIAVILVEEEYRRQRVFSDILSYIQEMNPWPILYLENVNSPILKMWCQKNNWKEDLNKSFYKRSKKELMAK